MTSFQYEFDNFQSLELGNMITTGAINATGMIPPFFSGTPGLTLSALWDVCNFYSVVFFYICVCIAADSNISWELYVCCLRIHI
jgi:hypothetical protein